jgi:hypothetical protein
MILAPDENDTHTTSDARDASSNMRPPLGTDFTQGCLADGLEGKRIAVSCCDPIFFFVTSFIHQFIGTSSSPRR